MTLEKGENRVIQPLAWDTDYFGIPCGRAILNAETTEEKLQQLVLELDNFAFVTLQNVGNCPDINRFIAQNTQAYLADVNIQFKKECTASALSEIKYPVVQAALLSESVSRQLTVDRSDFIYSKFVCDPEMDKRMGYKVYEKWLYNARFSENKYFIYCMDGDTVAAYILFSIQGRELTIELVKVNTAYRGSHLASALMEALEGYAMSKECRVVHVGTQLNNIPAINLYHHLGFKDISRTSVYHSWNQSQCV